jgi:hypothetical protein
VKREHHTKLILISLREEFAACIVNKRPADLGAMFWADDLAAHKRYRLKVSEPVLTDSRPDAAIGNALERAIPLMKENPGRIVFMGAPEGDVTAWLLEEE